MTRTVDVLVVELKELCQCSEEQLRPIGTPCIYCESRTMIEEVLREGLNLAAALKIARGHLEVSNNERDRALADMAAAQQARTAVQHRFNVLKSQYDKLIVAVDNIKASMAKAASG